MRDRAGFCGIFKALPIVVFLMLFICPPQNLLAQGNADGSIHGTVTDPSGAGIGGVSVSVKNNGTGSIQAITTGDSGIFDAQNLPPGFYSVKSEKPGFGTKTTDNVEVAVGRTTTLTIQLAVGSVSTTVNVEATIAPVTEDKGDRGVLLEPQTLAELPLQVNGGARLVDTFLTLAPGVTGDTFSARINGAPDFSQDFYYDGIPYMNADGGGRQEGLGAPFEAVDEYAVVTNAYDAQYGRGAGLLNFHIRSGTNQLHGGGWEYLRNNDLDSKGFFANSVPTEKQDEFGFKLGGPVYIPKLYDGKDKTFFFVNFNWFRYRGGISESEETLPTAAMKTGDFSSVLTNTPVLVNNAPEINPCDGSTVFQGQIFDPSTTRTVNGEQCRTAFPGNIIPMGNLSALSAQYLALMPTATTNAPINNTLVAVPTAPENNLVYLFKVDHNINHSLVLHASYYKGRFTTPTSPVISGPLGTGNNFNSLGWEPRVSLDWTINSHLINQTMYSVQYTEGVRIFFPLVPSSFTSPISTPGQPYPALAIQGEPSYGAGSDNGQNSGGCWPCTFFADNVKWSKGRHNIAFGTEIRFEDEKDAFATNIGTYSFSSGGTSLPFSPASGQLGWGFASFFLGTPTTVTQTAPTPPRLTKTGYRALYFQDDMQVNKKLTLNMGLRWDVSLPSWSSAGYYSNFDPTVPNPGAGGLPGSLVYAGNTGTGGCISAGGSSTCMAKLANTYWKNFEPRFGFAYRLSDKTTVRGGTGITSIRGGATTLMGPEVAASFLSRLSGAANFIQQRLLYSIANPWADLGCGYSCGWSSAGAYLRRAGWPVCGLDAATRWQAGYTQEWTLTVERQLPAKIAVEASYVGSASVHVGANLLNPNQVPSADLATYGSILDDPVNSPQAIAAGITIPYPSFLTDWGSAATVAQALRPFPMFGYIQSQHSE